MGSRWFISSFSTILILALLWGAQVLICAPEIVEQTLTANALIKAFKQDHDIAAAQYCGIVVEVEGLVSDTKGSPDPDTIFLQADDSVGIGDYFIECRLNPRFRSVCRAIAPGVSYAVFAGKISDNQSPDRILIENCHLMQHF